MVFCKLLKGALNYKSLTDLRILCLQSGHLRGASKWRDMELPCSPAVHLGIGVKTRIERYLLNVGAGYYQS